jgi:hypothetical protein
MAKTTRNLVKVLQIGLGPIGAQTTLLMAQKPFIKLVGGLDIDPYKVGKDLSVIVGLSEKLNAPVKADPSFFLDSKSKKPDCAVVTTVSSLEKNMLLFERFLENGVNVLSSCEELVYPWITHPALSKRLDDVAKANGVSILGTGVNPGFLMDFLPMASTAVCDDVTKIVVERIQDAQFRRRPFQKKIGMGLSREEFFAKVKEGALRHVGLTESMQLLASSLGWAVDKIEDVIEPVIATQQVFFGDIFIAKGDILGVNQIGRAFVGQNEVIRLVFRATIGEPEPRDRIRVYGKNKPMDIEIKGGLNGDTATCSILVNAVRFVVNASPGLRTMGDIQPISWFSGV